MTTPNTLLAWLQEGRLLMSDGAMGTVLQQLGLTGGAPPELWWSRPQEASAFHLQIARDGAFSDLVVDEVDSSDRTLGGPTLAIRVTDTHIAEPDQARAFAERLLRWL